MKQLRTKLILFVISPFIGFLHSFSKPWSSSSRVIVFLWFVVFGMCFTPTNKDSDGWQYAEEFRAESRASDEQYKEQISDYFYNFQTTKTKDIYLVTMIHFVSRFSSNVHLFFMILACVFAFFYVKSMKFVVPLQDEGYEKLIIPILFLLFCLNNPIFNINGVRFWTAAWVATYLVFQMLVNKKYIYLLLAPITVLIHASFVFFIVALAFYFVLGECHKLWKVLFFISLFFAVLSLGSSYNLSGLIPLPLFLENEMNAYSSDSAIMDSQLAFQSLPLYAQIANMLPRILINIIIVVLLMNKKDVSGGTERSNIVKYLIILMTFVNFTFVIPSVGVRFFKLVIPLLVYLLIKSPSFTNKYKYLVYSIPVAYSVDVLYWFRKMASVTSIIDYMTPLPVLFIKYLF